MHLLVFPPFVAVLLALALGGAGMRRLYRMSNVYGEHGLMKKSARRNLPSAMVSSSRRVFIEINYDGKDSRF